ncbi:hypothetical protein V1T76_08690 [Roseibium sp. FZY0029]|uniref:hypothetical protein n=1 Tax=Roseibium sp. FZY0029 TaxID=3116647 RepID=UPI002EBC7E21|nr:hypothetical protein [Roseibium sp. FZY0029]
MRDLDPTPTFDEELRDFEDEGAYSGSDPFDDEAAKTRIDKIARRLALWWSAFLVFVIMAQGIEDGANVTIPYMQLQVPILPKFHLDTAAFVAVVTTTTASVFGFLVIVSNHLFRDKKSK